MRGGRERENRKEREHSETERDTHKHRDTDIQQESYYRYIQKNIRHIEKKTHTDRKTNRDRQTEQERDRHGDTHIQSRDRKMSDKRTSRCITNFKLWTR